jgi:GNAT superfamily N-acetyltransferase
VEHEAEFIEQAELADIQAAATPDLRDTLRLEAKWSDSAMCSIAGALPPSAIVINRIIGLGLSSPATETAVREMVEEYARAGIVRYFVQVSPDARPADLVGWLEAAGLEKARGWQKFSRGREAPPERKTDLSIRKIGPESGEAFARIVCDAFDIGELAVPWLAQLPGREGWHVFMSFDGDRPAGTGTIFIKDGLASIDFGATAPAFRRRGSQGALLALRIEHALEMGCSRLFTCTGEAVEGDPQHSYGNILKCGFTEDYVRANYAPPRAGS